MSWLKLDDGFGDHPKVLELSDAAFRLHVRALCWVARQETDGAISVAVQRSLGAKPKHVAELVKAGLWDSDGEGHRAHDYLTYNPSHAKLEAERESTRLRVQRFRNGVTPPVTDPPTKAPKAGSVTALLTREGNPGVTPAPTRPDPSPEEIQPTAADPRPVRLAPVEAPPTAAAADSTDSDSMSRCPADLAERAEKVGMFGDIVGKFPTVSVEQLRHEAERYTLHFTFGAKAGTLGNRWMSRLRGQLVEKSKAGTLKAPGAIEHERHIARGARGGGEPEPFDAMSAVRRAFSKASNDGNR